MANVGSVAVWLGILLIASGCGSPQESGRLTNEGAATPASPGTIVDEVYHFDGLAQMVATSDAVVIATAVQEGPGRTSGEEGNQILHERVMFRVDELLFGETTGKQVAVETISGFAFDGMKRPPPDVYVQFNAGDQAVLFLWSTTAADGEPLYTYVNSQGAYRLQGGEVADLDRPADGLVERIQAMTRQDLVAGVGQANNSIAQGKVKALPRP